MSAIASVRAAMWAQSVKSGAQAKSETLRVKFKRRWILIQST